MVDYLFNILQQDGEPNRKNVTCFCQVVAKVEDPEDSVVISTFTRGISHSQWRSMITSHGANCTLKSTCLLAVWNTARRKMNSNPKIKQQRKQAMMAKLTRRKTSEDHCNTQGKGEVQQQRSGTCHHHVPRLVQESKTRNMSKLPRNMS